MCKEARVILWIIVAVVVAGLALNFLGKTVEKRKVDARVQEIIRKENETVPVNEEMQNQIFNEINNTEFKGIPIEEPEGMPIENTEGIKIDTSKVKKN